MNYSLPFLPRMYLIFATFCLAIIFFNSTSFAASADACMNSPANTYAVCHQEPIMTTVCKPPDPPAPATDPPVCSTVPLTDPWGNVIYMWVFDYNAPDPCRIATCVVSQAESCSPQTYSCSAKSQFCGGPNVSVSGTNPMGPTCSTTTGSGGTTTTTGGTNGNTGSGPSGGTNTQNDPYDPWDFAGMNSIAVCVPEDFCPYCCFITVPCCSESGAEQIVEELFDWYRDEFIMDRFYTDYFEKWGLKPMTNAWRDAFTWNVVAKGAMTDASNLLNATRLIDIHKTETAKNYTPSEQICRFGTVSRSLAASEVKAATNQLVLSEAGLSRNLGTIFSVGSAGRGLDNYNRLLEFVGQFCDLGDNNNGLDELCNSANPITDRNHNRDIDYARTIDDKPTINADFTDGSLKEDESDVLALGNYIYGHWQPLRRPSFSEMESQASAVENYNEYRSIIARRAAAQNSYAVAAALRTSGSGASNTYIAEILKRLGLSNDQIGKFYVPGAVNLSYNAQMEMLTRRIYQDPAFYANLMDSPANVERSSAAMAGIGLMQDRDIYKSTTRSEMLLGLLVQMEARKLAENIRAPRIGAEK